VCTPTDPQTRAPRFDGTDLRQPGRRPGILSEAGPDLIRIGGLDCGQGLLAISDRAAENDKAVSNQTAYERRVSSQASWSRIARAGSQPEPCTCLTAKLAMTQNVVAFAEIRLRATIACPCSTAQGLAAMDLKRVTVRPSGTVAGVEDPPQGNASGPRHGRRRIRPFAWSVG
jgi:hypothetical protein